MQQIDDMIAQLQSLKASLTQNTETRRTRHVSKMAKNLSHGDVALIGEHGFLEVNVWVQMGDEVTFGQNTRILSVPADQRVTVRREHAQG